MSTGPPASLCFLRAREEPSLYSMSPIMPLLDTGRVSEPWLGRHVNPTQKQHALYLMKLQAHYAVLKSTWLPPPHRSTSPQPPVFRG